MSAVREIPDKRALGLPDVPYSAYCRSCWQNVYALWIDKEPHGGACVYGNAKGDLCEQARSWEVMVGKIKAHLAEERAKP